MSDLPMDILLQRMNIYQYRPDHIGKFWLMRSSERRLGNMQIILSPQPVVALIAGILILLVPRLLNYIVAIYLIVFGILGLVR